MKVRLESALFSFPISNHKNKKKCAFKLDPNFSIKFFTDNQAATEKRNKIKTSATLIANDYIALILVSLNILRKWLRKCFCIRDRLHESASECLRRLCIFFKKKFITRMHARKI